MGSGWAGILTKVKSPSRSGRIFNRRARRQRRIRGEADTDVASGPNLVLVVGGLVVEDFQKFGDMVESGASGVVFPLATLLGHALELLIELASAQLKFVILGELCESGIGAEFHGLVFRIKVFTTSDVARDFVFVR